VGLDEVLILTLGPALAKGIAKLWLKDKSFASDVVTGLVDYVKSKTGDLIAQQRAKRQFEAIGEQVAESLRPLFEYEGGDLDEGGRTAAALAVADTLNKSGIDAELLTQQNLEPTTLAAHLTAAHPDATNGLSEKETSLYQRIISESSQYIVDIASQLPNFTERTFAAVLKREDECLRVAKRILDEVLRIREDSRSINPEAEAARFEEQYRRGVIRQLDRLELFGLDLSTTSRRYGLSVAYVGLSVAKESSGRTAADVKQGRREEGQEEDEGPETVSIDEALASSRRLFIRGFAGSGKTTLLQWIAVQSASEAFDDRLSDWNGTVPFFIRLRNFVAADLPKPEDFPGLVTPAIADIMPKGWAHDKLHSGRGIVLVDGVDEVAESERHQVRDWLKDLVETFGQARFILTSRPHAVEEDWMQSEGFDAVELEPMELPRVYEFIHHWHTAVSEDLRDEEERSALQPLAEHLRKQIRQKRAIRNLATSPLLCAMLCALHRQRHQNLPSDRIELYDACVQALVERRDPARGVDLSDYPALTYRQKASLLQDLAYWLMKNGWSMVLAQRAHERLAGRLPGMSGLERNVTGEAVLRLFTDRSGIVRQPVAGQVDFTHRTFQEFLAAQAAVDEGDIGLLVEKADDDQWREVIVLATGLAKKPDRNDLVRGLVERGDAEKDKRHQLHLLSVACLETSVGLDEELKKQVEERLTKLVPPKNMTEAKAISSAGELAVPYLSRASQSSRAAAACVRALGLIGGEGALTAIESYVRDRRVGVNDELFRAWPSFDQADYAARVISVTPVRPWDRHPYGGLFGMGLRYVPIDRTLFGRRAIAGIIYGWQRPFSRARGLGHGKLVFEWRVLLWEFPTLYGIDHLTDLVGVRVRPSEQIGDLAALARLANLEALDLTGCGQVRDLAPLARLAKLQALRFAGCEQLADLAPLARLVDLHTLDLTGCGQVRDLTPLARLVDLRTLGLSDCGQVRDLTPLAGLVKLQALGLSGCGQARDLTPLARLVDLHTLDLSGCGEVRDLAPLAGLVKLQVLDLSGWGQLRDLAPLAGLAKLQTLRFGGCEQLADLAPLARLVDLHALDLTGCGQVRDLAPLAGLTKLQFLHLSGCGKVAGIPQLRQRKGLNIWG